MSETKYTPGPWRVGTAGIRNDGTRPIIAGDRRVALAECMVEFKRGEGWKTECPEREANARLIAAAPTLLETLEGITSGMDRSATSARIELTREGVLRLLDAIAEAKGDV